MNELLTYFTRNVLQLVVKKGVCHTPKNYANDEF